MSHGKLAIPVKAGRVFSAWLLGVCALLGCANLGLSQIPEQYPKPLVHTPANHPAARVLLLSVDGLHAVDLANFVSTHPHSALAEVASRGVTYTNARTPIADPLGGLASLVTGGTPISTGVVSIDGYGMYKAGRKDRGLIVPVNTIFEVVHEKIGPTAWAGESAETVDLLRGASGKGVDEACILDLTAGGDSIRTTQVVHMIDGRGCRGDRDVPVPVLFGMSFTGIARAQQSSGYRDALATPTTALMRAFESIDTDIGVLVAELKEQHLYDTTWIAIAAPFGSSPIDPRQHRVLPLTHIEAVANAAAPGAVVHITGGGSVMLWLGDHTKAGIVAKALGEKAGELGILSIHAGNFIALTLNEPSKDSRMPDIVLQPQPGLRWTVPGDIGVAGYGGTLEEDTHVALLVSGVQLIGRSDPTLVPTTQLAPLLLRALGMEKFDLQALHREHTPALPGIF